MTTLIIHIWKKKPVLCSCANNSNGTFFNLEPCLGRIEQHSAPSTHVPHVRPNRCSLLTSALLIRPPLLFPCAVYWFKWKQVANPNKHHVKESSKQTEISAQHDTMGQENHRGTGAPGVAGGPQGSGEVYVCVDTCIHSFVHERTYEWPIMCGLVSLFKTFIWSISAITVIAAPALHHKQFF